MVAAIPGRSGTFCKVILASSRLYAMPLTSCFSTISSSSHTRVPGSRGSKARQHLHAHPMRHRHLDRARLQHLGAQRRHFQHLFVRDFIQLAGLRNDARIGRVDPVDVGEDVAASALSAAAIATAEVSEPPRPRVVMRPSRVDALEAGDHRDLPVSRRRRHFGWRSPRCAPCRGRRRSRSAPASPATTAP